MLQRWVGEARRNRKQLWEAIAVVGQVREASHWLGCLSTIVLMMRGHSQRHPPNAPSATMMCCQSHVSSHPCCLRCYAVFWEGTTYPVHTRVGIIRFQRIPTCRSLRPHACALPPRSPATSKRAAACLCLLAGDAAAARRRHSQPVARGGAPVPVHPPPHIAAAWHWPAGAYLSSAGWFGKLGRGGVRHRARQCSSTPLQALHQAFSCKRCGELRSPAQVLLTRAHIKYIKHGHHELMFHSTPRWQGQLLVLTTQLMPRGTLKTVLAKPETAKLIRWHAHGRQIAMDVAEALDYLHTSVCVLHSDCKPRWVAEPGWPVSGLLWPPDQIW